VLSHGPRWTLLRVDILNIMGPSIVLCAFVWRLARTFRGRIIVFAGLTAAIVFLTPAVRHSVALLPLPDFLAGYFRPIPELTNFTFFPWAAFVTAGTLIGVLLDAARTAAADRRVNIAFGAGGLALAAIAYEASFLPPLDPRSSFWTTSASFFGMRLGIMTAAIALAYLWEQRPHAGERWSPLQLMGRTSLFIYWIHVELVYGLIATPLKGAFSLAGAWAALGVFCLAMLAAAVLKERISRKFFERRGLRRKLSGQAQALMF
jgi:fucose 4-O-acetylase-like acetyltransferase